MGILSHYDYTRQMQLASEERQRQLEEERRRQEEAQRNAAMEAQQQAAATKAQEQQTAESESGSSTPAQASAPATQTAAQKAQAESQAKTDWLKDNPPPANASSKEYVEWVNKNPYATRADKAGAAIAERFNYDTQGITQAAIQQAFTDEEKVRLGIIPVQFNLPSADEQGNIDAKKVSLEDYYSVMDLPVNERLPQLIDLGLYPEGSKITSDVNALNKEFGFNIPEEFPFVTPQIDEYITQVVRNKGALRILKSHDLFDSKDHLDVLKAVEKGIKYETLKDAGFQITKNEYKDVQDYLKDIKEFETELKKSNPELYKIYDKYGIEGYNKAVEAGTNTFSKLVGIASSYDKAVKLNAQLRFKEDHTQLPDGTWMKNKDLEAIKQDSPFGYKVLTTRGYEAYKTEYDAAMSSLEPYKNNKGEPVLEWAMMGMTTKEQERLKFLYDEKLIEQVAEVVDPVKDDMKWLLEHNQKVESGYKPSLGDMWEVQKRELSVVIQGAPIGMSRLEDDLDKARVKLKESLSSLPTAVKAPTEFISRVAFGAFILAPIYTAGMTYTVLGGAYAKNKGEYYKQVAGGLVNYFKAIPGMVKNDPAMAGELIGVFLVGPKMAAKFLKGGAVRLDPGYIPGQAIRFSFSTGKMPVKYGAIASLVKAGKITKVQVATAIARAENLALKNPAKTVKAKIGNSNLNIIIEPTPVSKQLGGILWNAKPDKAAYLTKSGKLTVNIRGSEPALFTSPHAAPRFALMSASGMPATAPALAMIYTKSGLKWYPHFVSGAKDIAQMKRLGFEYLGSGKAKPGAYGPVKNYAGKFENEAMFTNGTVLYRVRSLRSRIFGVKAGDFVTVNDGWVMPIFRYAEKGAKIPKASLSKLAAIRIESIIHSLRLITKSDKGKGKAGFRSEAGYASVNTLAKQLEAIGARAAKGLGASKARSAYANAIDRAMAERLETTLRNYPNAERLYIASPERFERSYLERLNYHFHRQAGRRAPTRYDDGKTVTIRRNTKDEDRYINLARDYPRTPRPPDRVPPDRVPPDRVPPDRVPPDRVPPDRVPPDRVPPDRVPPDRVPPDRVPPDRVPPDRVPPDRVPPDRVPPDRVPPDRVPPDRVPPDRVPPDRVPPDRVPPPKKPSSGDTQPKKEEWQPEFVPGAIAWRQGSLKGKGGKPVPLYYVIKSPYESGKDVFIFKGSKLPSGVKPTPGGLKSASRSIQRVTGTPPAKLFLDMGIMDLKFDKPGVPGKGKGLSFKADPKQKTKGDITLGKGKVTYQKGNVKITEKPDTPAPIIKRNSISSRKDGNTHVVELGAGIVRERGKRHIKLY